MIKFASVSNTSSMTIESDGTVADITHFVDRWFNFIDQSSVDPEIEEQTQKLKLATDDLQSALPKSA